MKTRVKKWKPLPRNFLRTNFSYLFLATSKKDKGYENIPGIGNKSYKFSPQSYPFSILNDSKGFFFVLGTKKLLLFISCLQELMSFFINTKWPEKKRVDSRVAQDDSLMNLLFPIEIKKELKIFGTTLVNIFSILSTEFVLWREIQVDKISISSKDLLRPAFPKIPWILWRW